MQGWWGNTRARGEPLIEPRNGSFSLLMEMCDLLYRLLPEKKLLRYHVLAYAVAENHSRKGILSMFVVIDVDCTKPCEIGEEESSFRKCRKSSDSSLLLALQSSSRLGKYSFPSHDNSD